MDPGDRLAEAIKQVELAYNDMLEDAGPQECVDLADDYSEICQSLKFAQRVAEDHETDHEHTGGNE